MNHSARLLALTGWLIGCAPLAAAGEPAAPSPDPAGAIPADALAIYVSRPHEPTGRPSALSGVLSLVGSARTLGLIPEKGRLPADIAACVPVVLDRPFALALLDLRLQKVYGVSVRPHSLQVALVIFTGADAAPVRDHIRRFILAHTNSEMTTVIEETWHSEGGAAIPFHRLVDARLPEWAEWAWAELDDRVIVTLGAGAMRRMLAVQSGDEPALRADDWFARARADCRVADAWLWWSIRSDVLRDRFAEVTPVRAHDVCEELGLLGQSRTLWSIVWSSRALAAYKAREIERGYALERISDPHAIPPETARLVPPDAERFAVVRFNAAEWLPRLARAYVDARRVDLQRQIWQWWAQMQADLGVDVQRELLAPLGETVVLHSHPRHPLGLPIFMTVVLRIEGDPLQYERTLLRVLGHLAAASRPRPDGSHGLPLLGLRVGRTPDNIWYVQSGLFVVAGIAREREHLIVSYSPEAVRQNIEFLRAGRDAVAEAPAPPHATAASTPLPPPDDTSRNETGGPPGRP